MKKLIFFSALAFGSLLIQAQESYVMFETMYIDVKPDKANEFEAAFRAHNRKYHSEGASRVGVHYIVNGPWAGQFSWIMGPLTFSDLDKRPSDPAHEEDWGKVMPYVEKVSEVEYWRLDSKLDYRPEGSGFSKYHMRYFDVKPGKWEDFTKLLTSVVEVYKAKKYPNSMSVYWSQFNTGNGRDVVAVQGFNKYSEYDKEDTWVADFESVHGEGSWKKTMDALIQCTDGMTEELREVVPELGGSAE
jgi:hypothetical protein